MRFLIVMICLCFAANASAEAKRKVAATKKTTKAEAKKKMEAGKGDSIEPILRAAKLHCGYGGFTFTTKSKRPQAILEIYARKQLGLDVKNEDEFSWQDKTTDIPGADDDTTAFGYTDAETFASIFEGGPGDYSEGDAEKMTSVIGQMQKKFKDHETRFIYGFGGGTGGSVCGVTWPGPILIDLKSKKVYDFTVVCGEC